MGLQLALLRIFRGTPALVAAVVIVACGPTVPGSPSGNSRPPAVSAPAVVLYWASHQVNTEPHYRLLFEGGTETERPQEVRILDQRGGVVAAGPTKASAEEQVQLCPPTRDQPTRGYGSVRATLSVPGDLFNDFAFRRSADFSVEVLLGSSWVRAGLTNVCHLTE